MRANETMGRLRGMVTERDLSLAEGSFPGIGEFYRRSPQRYTTFLELVWAYQERPVVAF
jgi:hypothetical protein